MDVGPFISRHVCVCFLQLFIQGSSAAEFGVLVSSKLCSCCIVLSKAHLVLSSFLCHQTFAVSPSIALAEPFTTQLLEAPSEHPPFWRRFADAHLYQQVASSLSEHLLLHDLQTSLDQNHTSSTLFDSGARITYSIIRLDIINQQFSHSPTLILFHLSPS